MNESHRLPDYRYRRCAAACISLLLALVLGAPFALADVRPTALIHEDRLVPQEEVPLRIAPAVDLQSVALEDEQRQVLGLAPRFAIPNEVRVTPETDGIWERVGRDTLVWRLRIASPGAVSLNLGFTRYRMPEGGRLLLYSADRERLIRPFTAADNAIHGELWTPVLPADEIVVEVTVPEVSRSQLELELTSINVGYRGWGKVSAERSGSCNVDVVCSQGDGWRDEIPSVAGISTGGSLFCTGFMVNNTAQDGTPYFMTANHCGINSSNDASLVVYWNFETSTCGGVPDGSLSDFQTGSFWRASYSASDFTLVELDSDPDPTWGVTYAGWNRGSGDATSAVAIHHPSGDEKRISFEYDPTMTTSYLGTSSPGNGTHVRVVDWDLGTTEPGSSGSPLFDQNHRVIGQLHGGYAACGNDSSDWYGKFAVSWNGGGTSSSRLSVWLDPGNTGAMTVDTLAPNQCQTDPECSDGLFCNGAEVCFSGTCKNGADPCPGQGCDENNDVCIPPVCDADGDCESGEDCVNCPDDCISGSGAPVCGNHVCEIGGGEDCLNCSQDCNGKTGGKPTTRYCCGQDADCTDSRCAGDGNTCSASGSGESYCCGDAVCEGVEDTCSCPLDCGPHPSSESGSCADGADNDCDGAADCADTDCATDPACACLERGQSCNVDTDCCSNRCRGWTCK